MSKNLYSEQSGAVSMLTVIFISVILTILTTSFIRLTINEQREAIDDDLTTRAYYAAESGVQDAITAIRAGTVDTAKSSECAPNAGDGVLSQPSGLDTAYTCQTIDVAPSDYQASLGEGDSIFFKLDAGSANISSLKISWHIKGTTGDGDGDAVPHGTSELKKATDWGDSTGLYPAMLRTQLIEIPETGVNRLNIKNYVGFFNPSSSGLTKVRLSDMDGVVSQVNCDFSVNDGDYICSEEISEITDTTNDYYLRLVALYRPTHIKIEAFAGANSVQILNAQAVIDVTGRASDVYRRVEERISLTPDALWPEYAILSAESICKDFIITDVDASATKPDFAEVNPGIIGSCRN